MQSFALANYNSRNRNPSVNESLFVDWFRSQIVPSVVNSVENNSKTTVTSHLLVPLPALIAVVVLFVLLVSSLVLSCFKYSKLSAARREDAERFNLIDLRYSKLATRISRVEETKQDAVLPKSQRSCFRSRRSHQSFADD